MSHRLWKSQHLLAVVVLGILAGCSSEDGLCPRDLPPTACIRMGVVRFVSHCPLAIRFHANPDCSEDDRTPYEDLQIRWDFDADGTWDTGFGPMKSRWDAGPSSLCDTIWHLRCEVRDLAGQTGETTDSLDLRPLLPRPPDIIAGEVTVRLLDSAGEVDTVSVGQRFCILICERCWMDPTDDSFLIEYQLDGEVIGQVWSHVSPPMGGCWGSGNCNFTIDQAGTHHMKVTLDAGNTIVETNETNNIGVKDLVVIDSPAN